MKKYLLGGLAIVILGILVYLELPYIKFLTLYGLTDEQKERFEIMSENQSISENYQMYEMTKRKIRFDNFMIDRFLLDPESVKEEHDKYSSGLNAFLEDYDLGLTYKRYIQKGDELIFERINEIAQHM